MLAVAEIGSLSTQLMWHALNVGNVKVALDLMDLGQKQPTPVSFPVALLRALLVACHQSGFIDKSSSLFEQLKLQRVYNPEPLGNYPCDFQLSTMLTPAEVNLCLMDRLKEIRHRLRTTVGPKDKDLAIQIVGEHDPQLLALPFLALAPRSVEQAADVVILELNDISPLLRGTFNKQIKLVVVDSVSLGMYRKRFDSADLDPGFGWEKQASQSLPSSIQRPTAPLPYQSDHAIDRQMPKPASVAYSPHQPRGSVRSLLPVPSSTVPLPPQSVSAVGGQLSLPTSVSQQSAVAVERQMSVPSNPRSPPQQPGRPMKRQLSAPPNKPSTFKTPLLPTPPIPPNLQVAVAPTTSSSEPPPKKAKTSSPNKPIVGGRQPLKKNQQFHRSPPLPIHNMRGQQSPRGRGKAQQGNMFKYKKWSPVKSSKLSGKLSPQPTRDTRHLPIELPCSSDQGLQQTTQSIVQSLQQFPQHTGALYSDWLPGVTGNFPPPSTQSSDHLPPLMESVRPQFTEEARFSGPSHSNPSRSSGHFLLPSAESRDHLPPRTSESIGRSLPQFTEDVHFSGPSYHDRSRSSGHFPLPSTESRDHLPPLLAENIGESLPRFTEGTHLSRPRFSDYLGSSEHFPLQSAESRDHLPELAPFHHLPSQSKQRSRWSPPAPAQGAEQLRFDRATRESLHARFDDDCPPHQLLPARFDEVYHPPNWQPSDTMSQVVSRQSQPSSSLQDDSIPVITNQIRVTSSLLEEATEPLRLPDRFSRPLRQPSPDLELVLSSGRLLPNDHDRWAGQSGRTPPFADPRQWPDSYRQPRDFRER